ncbi:MAG: gamma-glutamyl-gamma-aminobutyrate hydrolase family protein [Litorilinea sp.]
MADVSSPSAHPTYPGLTIGMTVRRGDSEWLAKYNRNYLNVFAQFGVQSVILSPDQPAVTPDGTQYVPDHLGRLDPAVLDHLDGIVFSGGGDVDPRYFNAPLAGAEPEHIDHARDELELGLARAALIRDMPIFGICRGCQVLNVAAGGGMRQHLDRHRSDPDATRFHPVTIADLGLLYPIVQTDTISVNTFHHQGMDQATLAPALRAVAWADPDQWLIEAFDSPAHRWVLGVQWHPERLFELPISHQHIWVDFLNAALAFRRDLPAGLTRAVAA